MRHECGTALVLSVHRKSKNLSEEATLDAPAAPRAREIACI